MPGGISFVVSVKSVREGVSEAVGRADSHAADEDGAVVVAPLRSCAAAAVDGLGED